MRICLAGLLLGIVVSSSIQDGWVCGYAMSVALTLLWSVKNGYPKQEFYVSRTITCVAGIWVAFFRRVPAIIVRTG